MLAKLFLKNHQKPISSRSPPFLARCMPMIIDDQQNLKTCNGSALAPKAIPILLTVRELHHGGIERDVTKIALNLNRSRFEPHVASYQAEGMRFEELSRAGVPFLHLPLSSLKSLIAFFRSMKSRSNIGNIAISLYPSYYSIT